MGCIRDIGWKFLLGILFMYALVNAFKAFYDGKAWLATEHSIRLRQAKLEDLEKQLSSLSAQVEIFKNYKQHPDYVDQFVRHQLYLATPDEYIIFLNGNPDDNF